MNDLRQYIHSTFNMGVDIDAAQYSDNNKLRLLDKEKYYIYITPIHFINHKNKQDEYKNHIIKATKTWSNALNNKIKFEVIDSLYNADIKVYWAKTTRKSAGLQFTEHNTLDMHCIAIGVMDIDGTSYTSEEVYNIILHEFGHILGLGHSPNTNDVMSNKWSPVYQPSKNDILVLNLIYSLGKKSYKECEEFIEKYILQNLNQNTITTSYKRNIIQEIQDIANFNIYHLISRNISTKYCNSSIATYNHQKFKQ